MQNKVGICGLFLAAPLVVWGAGVLVLPDHSSVPLLPLVVVLSLIIWTLLYLPSTLRSDQGRQASDPAQFLNLVETAPDCIIVHRDNQILYANQHTLDFFGASASDPVTDYNILDFIHPRDHDFLTSRNKVVSETGKPSAPRELAVVLLDGTSRDIFASTTSIIFKGETALLTFFRDITDQVATRRELLDSRERLQLALDAVQDGVWDWDLKTGKMVYSPAWATMLGFDLAELQAHQSAWLTLIHPDDHARSNTLLEAHLRGDLPSYETEVRLRHKQGHYIWVLDRGRVVTRDNEGQPIRITGTHRNITAQKEAELALEIRNRIAEVFLIEDQRDTYGKLLETVIQGCDCPLGFFATIGAGGRLKIRATASGVPTAVRPCGSATLAAHEFPAIVASVIADRRSAILNRPHYIGAVSQEFQTSLLVPVVSRQQSIGLFVLGNKPRGFFPADRSLVESLATYLAPILQSNLTGEFREMPLRQAQKLEALGALAGGIAHDFNNILQAIMGFTNLALDEAPADSLIAKDLARSIKAARRGQDLVQRILLFSRREEQEQYPVGIQSIMTEALELLKSSLPPTIELRHQVAEAGGRIMADPSQIKQVVMNLATNAYHAMEDDGGILEIGLELVDAADLDLDNPHLANQEQLVHLWVADTGPGIPPEEQERVFEPFYTTKEVGRGTGLGLSVVHGIVISHQGQVQMQSQLGSGTTVDIYLPLHINDIHQDTFASGQPASGVRGGAKEPQIFLPASACSGEGSHILFVDDEEDIAAIGKAMLEKLGYRVTAHCDSADALAAVQYQPDDFDLIITDMAMPRLTGLQLAGKMANIREDLPVVLITGLGEDKDPMLGEYPNISGVIHKPFGTNALYSTINKVMANGAKGVT